MTITEELNNHINSKIIYHKELMKEGIANEEYLSCAKHRDEIARLSAMLNKEQVISIEV